MIQSEPSRQPTIALISCRVNTTGSLCGVESVPGIRIDLALDRAELDGFNLSLTSCRCSL